MSDCRCSTHLRLGLIVAIFMRNPACGLSVSTDLYTTAVCWECLSESQSGTKTGQQTTLEWALYRTTVSVCLQTCSQSEICDYPGLNLSPAGASLIWSALTFLPIQAMQKLELTNWAKKLWMHHTNMSCLPLPHHTLQLIWNCNAILFNQDGRSINRRQHT